MSLRCGRTKQGEQRRVVALQRIPPAEAFRHAWPGVFVVETYDDDIPEPNRVREEGSWHLCFTWQLGLATGVLLLPSFSLPILQLSYQGLAAEFMTTTQREVCLWQLPRLLWHPCTDNKWMVVLCQVILILQIVVLPLVGLLCGLASLRSSSLQKYVYRKCLSCIHPMMNGLTFACTVILFAPGLESITRYLFNEDSSGLCDKFNNTLGEPCLTVSGSTLPGAWFFLAQSLLLEVFCAMVLSLNSGR